MCKPRARTEAEMYACGTDVTAVLSRDLEGALRGSRVHCKLRDQKRTFQ